VLSRALIPQAWRLSWITKTLDERLPFPLGFVRPLFGQKSVAKMINQSARKSLVAPPTLIYHASTDRGVLENYLGKPRPKHGRSVILGHGLVFPSAKGSFHSCLKACSLLMTKQKDDHCCLQMSMMAMPLSSCNGRDSAPTRVLLRAFRKILVQIRAMLHVELAQSINLV
jgi:hypothetical protein